MLCKSLRKIVTIYKTVCFSKVVASLDDRFCRIFHHFRIMFSNDILISAATTRVRKSKPSKKSKPWMTPHMRAKIRTRNRLRRKIYQNRQNWIDACREATKAVNEAKTESWKDLLQDEMSNSDGPNMWKIIQGLNSTPDANSPNEVMSYDGRTITDIKSKANVFINHYARVSKLIMSQADRDINQQFKKRLNAPSVEDESCAPLQMGELLSVIKKMKGKGAGGPDNIPPSFLKLLSPLALQESLSIFNSYLLFAHCPRIWRVATIILLLKTGKSPSEVVSFRPISLTPCFVKLLEHILADRLYYIAETNNLFSRLRAGFRKGQSCKDQNTRIVQAKEDDSQQRPMQRSVLTLLDFSKAYDTIWRIKLLIHMLETGIPSAFIRWIQSFFNDRRARAQLFNVFIPVDVFLKVYLKVTFSLCYSACSTSSI